MPASIYPSRRRLWTFRIITAITALLIVFALPNLLAPWLDVNLNPAIHHPELERWHTAVEGAGDACALVVLIALLWRPAANPLAAASLAVSAAVSAVLVLPFTGPSMLFILVPVALIAASYPYWRLLRGVRRQDLRPVRALLAVAVLSAAALAAPVTSALRHQIAGVGEPAVTNQWATYAERGTSLALSALLVSLGLPGWRLLAGTLAARYLYLGVAAIALPAQPDSWGVAGGIAALAAGTVIAVAVLTARARPIEAQSPPSSVPTLV